jgi:thiol:disulfide interchange protein
MKKQKTKSGSQEKTIPDKRNSKRKQSNQIKTTKSKCQVLRFCIKLLTTDLEVALYTMLNKRKQETKATSKPEKLRVTDNQIKKQRTNISNMKSKQKRSEKLSPKMLKICQKTMPKMMPKIGSKK